MGRRRKEGGDEEMCVGDFDDEDGVDRREREKGQRGRGRTFARVFPLLASWACLMRGKIEGEHQILRPGWWNARF